MIREILRETEMFEYLWFGGVAKIFIFTVGGEADN